MGLTNALKILYKLISLTQTITSASFTASQEKTYVTEASVDVFNRNNCDNLFHCWQVVSASVTSFNQTHSHWWTYSNIRWTAFGRAIIVRFPFAVDTGTLMVTQYLMCMTVYMRKGIVLSKHSWKLHNGLRINITISGLSSFSSIAWIKDIQLGVGRLTALTGIKGPWRWQSEPWIWKAFNPPLLLLLLARSSAETMSQPKEVNTKAALYWRRLSLKCLPWVSVLASKSFEFEAGQARTATGLIPACSMIPSWGFSKMISLAFHRSNARRDSVSIPCPYIQGPKGEGEKAARYKQQEWSEKALL